MKNPPMQPESDPNLESLLDAELKKLPPIPAPRSLLPKVLSAIAARARQPWWQRAWWDWPLTAKAAFLLLTLGIVSALSGGGVILDEGVATYSQRVVERLTPVGGLWDAIQTVVNAVALSLQKLMQPFMLSALIFVGATYLLCVGLGTACVRYALKRD
jgi:hypothetical protein